MLRKTAFSNYFYVAARQRLFSKTASLTEKVVGEVGLGLDVGVGVYAVAKAPPGDKMKSGIKQAVDLSLELVADRAEIGVASASIPVTSGISMVAVLPIVVVTNIIIEITVDKIVDLSYNNVPKWYKNYKG